MTAATSVKVASITATVLLAGAAVAVGGGHPISPARIARSTSEAARNVAAAEDNTSRTVASTRALLTITRNVDSQVRSSRRLLEIQLRLEASSRRGAARSADLQRGIDRVKRGLTSLREDIATLTALSRDTVESGRAAASAGNEIERRLAALERRFREVIKQSRRLNKKARGLQEIRDGPR